MICRKQQSADRVEWPGFDFLEVCVSVREGQMCVCVYVWSGV